MMRPIIMLFTSIIFSSLSSCAGARSESLDLSDRIVAAAITLKQGSQISAEIAYTLGTDAPSLVAVVPASGVDTTELPDDAIEQQVSGLIDSAKVWRGRTFLSITWPGGTSTGPTIEEHVSVPRQLSVLKPPGGTVTVRLVRDATGTVTISELR